jgi:membrane-associated protease RseP (regulator of RpoE activity)
MSSATHSSHLPGTGYFESVPQHRAAPASAIDSSGGVAVPLLLFTLTLLTTSMMGARFTANFVAGYAPFRGPDDLMPIGWIMQEPARLFYGLPFSITLLSILLAHELGHYFACRRHNVEASLPHFVPLPALSGTMGAVIRLRTRVESRAALLDIGVSGPLWGFFVAIPLTIVGILLSSPVVHSTPPMALHVPPIFIALNQIVQWVRPGWPDITALLPHPILLACWIGMFVTFLNLLPAGQLDGGHILYAAFPRAHHAVTQAVVFILLFAGVMFWMGWIIWAIVLMLPSLRHPKISTEPGLNASHAVSIVVAILLLLFTLMPEPFAHSSLLNFLH